MRSQAVGTICLGFVGANLSVGILSDCKEACHLPPDNDLHKTKLSPAEDNIRKRKALVTRRLFEALGTLTMIVRTAART